VVGLLAFAKVWGVPKDASGCQALNHGAVAQGFGVRAGFRGSVRAWCDGDEDEASLEQLQAPTKVFVPEQVQDDFIEVRCYAVTCMAAAALAVLLLHAWLLLLWMRLCW
jgi:hypothetical protein